MADLSVTFPPFVVWRSKLIIPDSYDDPAYKPDYEDWQQENRLEVLEIFKSSSIIGPSYAKIRIATGQPVSPQVNPEDADGLILENGDRVAIGLLRAGNRIDWLFCGYAVTAAILVDQGSEELTFMIAGPEWAWGTVGETGGGACIVFGQHRRNYVADDIMIKSGAPLDSVTAASNVELFSDLRTAFNPNGRGNMSKITAQLTPAGADEQIIGRIFDEPDRKVNGTEITEQWNALEAAKYILTKYNDRALTGIMGPATQDEWDNQPMRPEDLIAQVGEREVDVDGYGVYVALARILHPHFGFWINPIPTNPLDGKEWGDFECVFFSRSRDPGTYITADLRLNARGTTIKQADASINRLEAARDISKLNNKVIAAGRYIRPVRLVFWGGATSSLSDDQKKQALQCAWKDADGKLTDFGASDAVESSGGIAVNLMTIDSKAAATKAQWYDRFVTTGKDHALYPDTFRRFVWNEAGEWINQSVTYGTGAAVQWFLPDLTGIANLTAAESSNTKIPDRMKQWARRRRPLLDTIYQQNDAPDAWTRVRPSLYFAIAKSANDKSFDKWIWRKVPESFWSLDPNRAGFWITVDNIADWRPFDQQDRDDQQTGKASPNDARSFATLLAAGVLRMCIEGTITVDHSMEKTSLPSQANGSAHLRTVYIRTGNSFIKTLQPFADGLTSPSKLNLSGIDKSQDAQAFADLTRDMQQEPLVHASVGVEGDWKEQAIGAIMTEIGGSRKINLRSSTFGRGTQIVAIRLDVRNGDYEYLTESAALALRDRDRRRFASGTKIYERKSDRSL
jgi:hypothetical protein